jgi:hypothetical protein
VISTSVADFPGDKRFGETIHPILTLLADAQRGVGGKDHFAFAFEHLSSELEILDWRGTSAMVLPQANE